MYVCIAEIARLSEELNALKGSEEDRSPMSHDISSSVSAGHLIASLETEDLWLGVQVPVLFSIGLAEYGNFLCMYICM